MEALEVQKRRGEVFARRIAAEGGNDVRQGAVQDAVVIGHRLADDVANEHGGQHRIVQLACQPEGQRGAEAVVVEDRGMEVAAEDGFLGCFRSRFSPHGVPDGRLVKRLPGPIAVQQDFRLRFDGMAHG